VPSYGDPSGPAGSDVDGTTDSTTDVAKSQAADVARSANEAGQQVVGVAKEQTQEVTAEAGRQARDLLRQTQSELADQAGTQQQRLADGLNALADELGSMADRSEHPGMATDLVRQAADRSHEAASWLRDREPGAVLNDIRDFARRRPGAFLALAAGAGLLAGRLTRGLKESSGSDTGTTSSDRDSAPASPAVDYRAPARPAVDPPSYPATSAETSSPLMTTPTDEPALTADVGRTDSRP
jgi:hypothetical protein